MLKNDNFLKIILRSWRLSLKINLVLKVLDSFKVCYLKLHLTLELLGSEANQCIFNVFQTNLLFLTQSFSFRITYHSLPNLKATGCIKDLDSAMMVIFGTFMGADLIYIVDALYFFSGVFDYL